MKKLIFTLAIFGILTLSVSAQQTFVIGKVFNTNGASAIPMTITAVDSSQNISTYNVVTDSLDCFTLSIPSAPWASMTADYLDCDGNQQSTPAFGLIGQVIGADTVLFIIDYCSNIQSPPVNTIVQATVSGSVINADSLSNIPVTISVYDTSFISSFDTIVYTNGPNNSFSAAVSGLSYSFITTQITDCNGNASEEIAGYLTSTSSIISGVEVDYCQGVIVWPPVDTSCNAQFTVTQSTSPSGSPIANEATIWDQSTGNGSLQYLWLFGSFSDTNVTVTYDSINQTAPTYTFNNSGPYYLCLILFTSSGCFDFYCDSINVDSAGFVSKTGAGMTFTVRQGTPTSIEEIQQTASIDVYPNPASNNINVVLDSKASEPGTISIFDINGREVRNLDVQVNQGVNRFDMDVSGLEEGIYMYNFTSKSTAVNGKFVKR